MGKILGSWSGMRKYLEEDICAESLRGRIRYGCTTYVGMDDCRVFELCFDKIQIKRFSHETVNSYFIENNLKEKTQNGGVVGYWEDYWSTLNKYPMSERREYTDKEFCDALEIYRNQDIQKSICDENAIVRMFAVLDRRIGKRTLEKVKGNVSEQPFWLQEIYTIRFDAERL